MGVGVTVRTIQVLVVDDHPIVLDGVSIALGSTSWINIAGYARCGRDAVMAVSRLHPDVVLLDYGFRTCWRRR